MKRPMLLAVLSLPLLVGCGSGPARYTGGGWLPSSSGDGKANFGLNADFCGLEPRGHFTFHDKNAVDLNGTPIPGGVKFNARILGTGECLPGDGCIIDGQDGAATIIFAYESRNPRRPGGGIGFFGFVDNGEGQAADPDILFGLAVLSINDDVYAYVNAAEVKGNIQRHECH